MGPHGALLRPSTTGEERIVVDPRAKGRTMWFPITVVVASSFVVAACSANLMTGKELQPPTNYKAIILANEGRLWKDTDSIKNASIAPPTRHMCFMWHVCVRMNAKNSFGGYTGEKDSLVGLYDDGKPPAVIMEDAGS